MTITNKDGRKTLSYVLSTSNCGDKFAQPRTPFFRQMCTGWGRWSWTWVGLTLILGILPQSAWPLGSLAEWAVELGKIMEHPYYSQLNLCPRPVAPPCTTHCRAFFHQIYAPGLAAGCENHSAKRQNPARLHVSAGGGRCLHGVRSSAANRELKA